MSRTLKYLAIVLLAPSLAAAIPHFHNDNAVSVCNELLARFRPEHTYRPSDAEPLVDAGRDAEIASLEEQLIAASTPFYGRDAGALSRRIHALSEQYPRLTVSPTGQVFVLSKMDDGRLVLRRGHESFEWSTPALGSPNLVASPDGRYLALTNFDSHDLHVVKTETGERVLERQGHAMLHWRHQAEFTSNSRGVALRYNDEVEVVRLGFAAVKKSRHDLGPVDRTLGVEGTNVTKNFKVRSNVHALNSLDRLVAFFHKAPALLIDLVSPTQTLQARFEGATPTVYTPTPVPPSRSGAFETMLFKYHDEPRTMGNGLVSARETFVVENRRQYTYATQLESFVDIYALANQKHQATMAVPGTVSALAMSADESLIAIATAGEGEVRVYRWTKSTQRPFVKIEGLTLSSLDLLAFTEDHGLLVGSSRGAKLLKFPLPVEN